MEDEGTGVRIQQAETLFNSLMSSWFLSFSEGEAFFPDVCVSDVAPRAQTVWHW